MWFKLSIHVEVQSWPPGGNGPQEIDRLRTERLKPSFVLNPKSKREEAERERDAVL